MPEPSPHKNEFIGIDIWVKSPFVIASKTPNSEMINAIKSVDKGLWCLIKIPPRTMKSGLKYCKIVAAEALPL